MSGTSGPQIVTQQGRELCGDEAHLGSQLHPLFADKEETFGQFRTKKNHRLPQQ
jgi:hypothetical protein